LGITDLPDTIPEIDVASANFHTFSLVYTKGKNIPNTCKSVSTTIEFYCSAKEGRGSLVLYKLDDCNPVFIWNSSYACPKCNPEVDIIKEYGSCIDNLRIVSYRYARPCNAESVLIHQAEQEPCEGIKVGRSTAIFAVAIVLLLVLIGLGLAFLFFRQKRDLETKYKILKSENNLDDSDEDGLGVRKDDVEIGLEDDSLPEVPEKEDDKDPI